MANNGPSSLPVEDKVSTEDDEIMDSYLSGGFEHEKPIIVTRRSNEGKTRYTGDCVAWLQGTPPYRPIPDASCSWEPQDRKLIKDHRWNDCEWEVEETSPVLGGVGAAKTPPTSDVL